MSYQLGRNEDEIRSVMDRLKQEGGFLDKNEGHASPPDMVNKPPHYQMPGGIETIDYIEAVLAQDYFKTVPGIVAHCVGNVLKYASRPTKGKFSQSIRKAAWYCNRAADALEKIGE